MISEDDFQYALENTEVILAPQRQIATFGETSFRFYMVTELMDRADAVRVREGKLHAGKPQIMTQDHFAKLMLKGFGEDAENYMEAVRDKLRGQTFLKYGFQFRKTDVAENVSHDPLEDVLGRIKMGVSESDEPLTAIIRGVDDAWEVCLLKFSIDLIQKSAPGNFGDFKNRGLL